MAGSYKWGTDDYLMSSSADHVVNASWLDKEMQKHNPRPLLQASFAVAARPGDLFSDLDSCSSRAGSVGGLQQVRWQAPSPDEVLATTPVAAHRGRIRRGGGPEHWSRCAFGAKQASASAVAAAAARLRSPDQLAEPSMQRCSSSPTTLTFEGKEERLRIFGSSTVGSAGGSSAAHFGSGTVGGPLGMKLSATHGARRTASTPMSRTPSLSRMGDEPATSWMPRTSNQMYGAKAHEAEKGATFLPRGTCDIVQFVDQATKTKTNYCAEIRF